jgi:hypothetical protein
MQLSCIFEKKKLGEDRANVLEVFCLRSAEDQNVVEEDKHKVAEERPENFIHQGWNVDGAFVRLKGMTMTRNSKWP